MSLGTSHCWIVAAVLACACGSSPATGNDASGSAVLDVHFSNDTGKGKDVAVDAKGAETTADTANGPEVEQTPSDSSTSDLQKSDTGLDVSDPIDTNQPAVCGNGNCETDETAASCPDDCKEAGPVCGDKICQSPETLNDCATDCPSPICGDLWCQTPEDSSSCEIDCDVFVVAAVHCLQQQCGAATANCLSDSACRDVLSNGLSCVVNCAGSQDCIDFCQVNLKKNSKANAVSACGFDSCAGIDAAGVCGDGTCGIGENGSNCKYDCGTKANVCGDGACVPPETPATCSKDCKPLAVCGNGSCENGETANNCAADCAVAPKAKCGDLNCTNGETPSGCPLDCDPAVQGPIACAKQKCAAEMADCTADAACVAALQKGLVCIKDCGAANKACSDKCQSIILANGLATSFAICGLQNCPPP